MCGILFTNIERINKIKFVKSLKLLTHRGPDNTSYKFFNNKYKLGHTRLSILDLDKRSNQPFTIGNLTLIFNGEIYNYIELIKSHNLSTTTKSDTEVILLMYIKYKENCLKFFNGMFSFIIYNSSNNKIFAARDRLGIKPLYYFKNENKYIFSSEIKPILNLINTKLDSFSIRQYKKLRMTVNNDTFYSDVKMFPAGYYLSNNFFYKYWSLKTINDKRIDMSKVEYLLTDSINIRKRTDTPFGSFLSGGLDSTIVTSILKPAHTWTVGFKNQNEFKWSTLANKKINSNHHKILITYDEFKELTKKMVNFRKEPIAVPNEVLIYKMSVHASKFVKVLLSGEGADELFYGYDRIFKWANKNRKFSLNKFDEYYAYGSHQDYEVLDYALQNVKGKNSLEKISYFMQIKHLHGLLRRLDNSTMMSSIEARVPFCDHRLVEYVNKTSFRSRMGPRVKEPLKKIFTTLIDNSIINRKKVGFPTPLAKIFKKTKNKSSFDKWFSFNIDLLKK
jgi:asparagine synthase (glutamine-hydrolysing)